MKRDEFLNKVAQMCGPAETEAVHRLAETLPRKRHNLARRLGQAAADDGLMKFLMSLINDDLIDDLAAILPKPGSPDEAEVLLKRLWARLLVMTSPEAREVLYAHNQLRLMIDIKARKASAEGVPDPERAYRSALETALAVLAATGGSGDEEKE